MAIVILSTFGPSANGDEINELQPVQMINRSIGIKIIEAQADLTMPLINARKRIFRSWFAPHNMRPARAATIAITLDEGGKIATIKLQQPSGMEVFDRSALRAVNNAVPFQDLPAKKTIVLQFNYAVYPPVKRPNL